MKLRWLTTKNHVTPAQVQQANFFTTEPRTVTRDRLIDQVGPILQMEVKDDLGNKSWVDVPHLTIYRNENSNDNETNRGNADIEQHP